MASPTRVMVTAGANQAYTNMVLTLLDAGDAAALFAPYYFNHLMALQMTGSHGDVVIAPSTASLQPDVGALRAEMAARKADGRAQVTLVTIANPGNPTGVMVPAETLQAASELCAEYGAWLVLDNCYEAFAYPGEAPHVCIEGEHIINLFSFSKAFGMMGWRVGYAAFPQGLAPQLLKAQDTIVICPSTMSQKVALAALQPGTAWVRERVDGLAEQKAIVLSALHSVLPAESARRLGRHLLFKLPEGVSDDLGAIKWFAAKHGVALIPGSACGLPGFFRVCYANLPLEKTREAAARLEAGLKELASGTVDLSEAALAAL